MNCLHLTNCTDWQIVLTDWPTNWLTNYGSSSFPRSPINLYLIIQPIHDFIQCGYCAIWRIGQLHFVIFGRNCFFRFLISHLKHDAKPIDCLRRKMIISVFQCLPAVSALYIKDYCQEFSVCFRIYQNKDVIKIITIIYSSIEVGVHMEQDFSTTRISMTILVSCAKGP